MEEQRERATMPTPIPRLHLTQARTTRRWSQREVAERVGSTPLNVSRWECGTTRPGPYYRKKLCILFGKTEEELDLTAASAESLLTSNAAGSQPVIDDPLVPLPSMTALVGRDGVLRQLKQRLCAGGNGVVTAFNGLPGVGKTALAVALVHDAEVRTHFRDGVLWAGLGPHPQVQSILGRWGTLLGIPVSTLSPPGSVQAWTLAIRSAIGPRRMLLVLDDVWQLEEALLLQVGGMHCAHLVTTRFPLLAAQLAGEGASQVEELDDEESLALLRQYAPQVVAREGEKARELVREVGGLPLGLMLMGRYLQVQSYSGQARRIHAALTRLSDAEQRLKITDLSAPVGRHPSLQSKSLSLSSVLSVSDLRLTEASRAAFYALSVFPAKPYSFSEEAALAVGQCTFEGLDLLVDVGLLESRGAGRYALHQIIADYARAHLEEVHESAAQERLIAYSTSFLEKHNKDDDLLEIESPLILATFDLAQNLNKDSELVRGVIAFAPFLIVRGLYPLAQRLTQRAYEAACRQHDADSTATLLLYLGQLAKKQGHVEQAEASFQEGVTVARERGNPQRISALLTELGALVWKRGDYAQAELYLQEGLLLARESGEGELLSSLLTNLGVTAGEQGKYAQAEAYLREALAQARQLKNWEMISCLLSNLGETLREQGDFQQAEACFQEGLLLARQISHREWISILLCNLGGTLREQGNITQAAAYLQESLIVARQVGIPQILAFTLNEYGHLLLLQHQLDAAAAMFRELLSRAPQQNQNLHALASYGLACVAAAQGNRQEALQLGERSATMLEAINNHYARKVRTWLNNEINQAR
jgi:tetratricopeptide (TPR) repeat protein